MSSKHSILLGTDGPDGDSSTGKFITPSAHVLAATKHSSTVGQQHSAVTNTAGEKYITASPSVAMASSGFGDADAEQLLPSSRDSVAARLPFDSSAPRTLSSTSADAATPAPAPAPAVPSTGFINPELAQSMSTLSATFASMLAEANKGEQEQKVESTIQSLQSGSSEAGAATTEAPKLSTCFDLITSTATRIPLSTIIAASASHPSHVAGGASASVSSLALESYVVVEPIDWSRHHHDSTFARLTAVNRGADQVDEIALELAAERNALQKQLDDRDKTIQEQRAQIQALQRQLHEATRNNSGAASASPAPAAAVSASVASSAPARAAPAASGPAASLPSDADDDSDDDLDIDEGMCDEEDSGHGTAAAAGRSADKKAASSATFAI